MMKYKLVNEVNIGEFEKEINRLLENGWEFSGNLVAHANGPTIRKYQPMIRGEIEAHNNQTTQNLLMEIYHLRRGHIRPGEVAAILRLKAEFMKRGLSQEDMLPLDEED